MIEVAARSFSRPVGGRLRRAPFRARVRAVFERACYLRDADGEFLALVLPELDDGPLNLVVHGGPGLFDTLAPGVPTPLIEGRLQVGPLAVDLNGATVWEPCLDWPGLRARREVIASQVPFLRALCLAQAPAGSLLALLSCSENSSPFALKSGHLRVRTGLTPARRHPGVPYSSCGRRRPRGARLRRELFLSQSGDRLSQRVLNRAREAVAALTEGPRGWCQGVLGLAGLGSGLTPAGDDWLSGLMLWAWLAHPAPARLGRDLVDLAAPRTGALSAAFLRAAARGECSPPWHHLLDALSRGERAEIALAAQAVLARGATSGADTLAGFLGAHLVLQATL